MPGLFTDGVRKVMRLAKEQARRLNHEWLDTHHILLGLSKDATNLASTVLNNFDINYRMIRLEVDKIIPSGPDSIGGEQLPMTPCAKQAIRYSIEEAEKLSHSHVGTEHLLLGLMRDKENVAAQVLANLGLTLHELRGEVQNR